MSLNERFVFIDNQHNAAAENALKRAEEQAENERLAADEKKLSKQRQFAGVNFLDDPTRDQDYRVMNVVPLSEELLSVAPSALPRNLIQNSFVRAGEGEDDDEENDQTPNVSALSSKGPATALKAFRSVNHYLNTHFQLNREDCLAQLRRGIKSYREKLEDANGVVAPPSHAKLQNVAKAMASSRGNDRMFMYDHVEVRSIERSPDGIGYAVSFNVFGGGGRSIDWNRSSRFMNGSLLCLSSGTVPCVIISDFYLTSLPFYYSLPLIGWSIVL